MIVYDTPSHSHWEPDIDPFQEDRLIEIYGENWRQALIEQEEEREFFMYEEERRYNI